MTKHFAAREFGRKNGSARLDDAKEFTEVMAALKARDAEIKSFAEKATAEIKANGQMATETKAALEKLSETGSDLSARLAEVEQKMSRRSGAAASAKSLGEQFTESAGFKALVAGTAEKARFEIKTGATITSATADAAGSAGSLIVPDRQAGIIQPGMREFTIRDLLMPGRTGSNSVEFVKETGYTNAAAPVAEGTAKPKSDLQFTLEDSPVRTIAHWFAASRQVLSDVPLLQSYIDGRAVWGLKDVEEQQLLRGNGQGQNLRGLMLEAQAFDEGLREEDDTPIDTIRRAALQVRLAEFRPTFVVMNPIDWAAIELTKDDNKRYLEVSIRNGGEMRLWRLAVVETTAIEPNEFLVGASMGAQIFDREDAAVEVATQHANFFTENLVAIRAEERLAMAVQRPESFVFGQFEYAS